ncbi:tumor necrosis factor alpha-induced protein 2 isoform 2-T2 [Polymixia lowei]
MRAQGSSVDTRVQLDSPTQPNAKSNMGKIIHFKFPKFRRNGKRQASVSEYVPDGPLLVQPEVLTFEQNLDRRCLSEAGQQLIDREENLFGEITDTEAHRRQEPERNGLVDKRLALLGLIQQTLKASLSPENENVELLTYAVKAVLQEEEQDRRWKETHRTAPPWRPSGWRRLHDAALQSLVEERMESPPVPAGQENQSSIQLEVLGLGNQMKRDLLRVVTAVKSCYPAELDICNLYAGMYHRVFSSRLRGIAQFGLVEKDSSFLLRWVNDYYSTMLKHQELVNDINCEALGKLLPEKLSGPLEETYLTARQAEVQTFLSRILTTTEQGWMDDAEPERDETEPRVCFFSPLAIDTVQCINGAVQHTEKVLGDQRKARPIVCLLKDFLQSLKKFQAGVIKRSKANSKPIIMANLACVEQFRDYIVKKTDLFPEDVKECCLSVLTDMKESGQTYLLSSMHKELQPQYSTLGTHSWLENPLFENLLDSIEEHIEKLQGLTASCHQELMGQLQLDVTVKYVEKLLKRNIKLKNKEMQEKASRIVSDDGQRLHNVFVKAGAREDWLNDILPKIAELLKLQDIPSMQLEVMLLGAAYPDLRDKHVSALLKLKTNVSQADRKTVKATLMDRLEDNNNQDAVPFFSRVQVK